MARLNTDFLESISAQHVGEAVHVRLTLTDTLAQAVYLPDGYCIQLNPQLVADKRAFLADCFWHELGHIVTGHVVREVRPPGGYGLDDIKAHIASGGSLGAVDYWNEFRIAAEGMEREATAWAKIEAAKWRVACSEAGTTFEALAIIEVNDD